MTPVSESEILAAVEQPALIGTTEAADRLGVDRSTLVLWVQLGKVQPAMKLPGRTGAYLFDPAAVSALALERAS